jgi:hypothetical protein
MAANVKKLALYHHDPNRSDDAVDQLISPRANVSPPPATI